MQSHSIISDSVNITDRNPTDYLKSRNFFNPRENCASTGNVGHNNMVPFYGTNMTQNMAVDSIKPVLDAHSGSGYYRNNHESIPLFKPTSDINAKHGTQNNNDLIQARLNKSTYRTMEVPFEKIHVGRTQKGEYSAKPSGGFHPDYRASIMPKTIDELRTSSNPRITYAGRSISGKALNNKPEQQGIVSKITPETAFEQTPAQYLVTTGAHLKEKQRPNIYLKDTNRMNTSEYIASANAVLKKPTSGSLYKKSSKNTYQDPGVRNAFNGDNWDDIEFNDYGKNTFDLPPNERDTTQQMTPSLNFASIFKEIIAPITDMLRPTKKQNTIGNIRQTGNIASTQLGVVYDPSDVARKTIKETTIHDTRTGHMIATDKGPILDKESLKFKTTIKETTLTSTELTNLKGAIKLTTYDPNDISRRTIKETNIHNNRTGNVGGLHKDGAYLTTEHSAPKTNRQGTSNNEYSGVADNQTRGLGYITNEHSASATNRQNTSNNEYEGTAMSFYKKPTSYVAGKNMRTNYNREATLKGRDPNKEGAKIVSGPSTMNVAIQSKTSNNIDTRFTSKDKIYAPTDRMIAKPTKSKTQYKYNILDEQINPLLLTSFNKNPYTQPLDSI
tara:strand:+ start:12524 stop:14365 length:1842 start_codon:yes stop_codon:yes gene_type:complete